MFFDGVFGKCQFILITIILFSASSLSAPYNGDIIELEQPDGSTVKVSFYGDEYYCRGESLDGYTVVRDPSTGWIVYAELNNNDTDFVPTSVIYNHRIPTDPNSPVFAGRLNARGHGLKKHIRIKANMRMEKHRKRRQKLEQPRPVFSSDTVSGSTAESQLPVAAAAPAPLTGSVVGLTVLVKFQDTTSTIPVSEVENFCNQVGYSNNGNNGSVRDYYYGVSGGLLEYTNVVTDYVLLDHEKSYYDNCSGGLVGELIDEAMNKLCDQGFDFSAITKSSGWIQACNFFYAGTRGCGWAEGLWPHKGSRWTWYDCAATGVGDYQITDMGSALYLGTFCHENGHMLCGWPDLYDYGYESNGAGNYDLMGYQGPGTNPVPPNPYFRYIRGWETYIDFTNDPAGSFYSALANPFDDPSQELITYLYTNPNNSSEYFLIENCLKTGRRAGMPDEGLLIWHIDENGSNNNEQMTPSQHYKVSIEQADGLFSLENGTSYGGSNDLFHAGYNDEFSDFTLPDATWWDGSDSGLSIYDISATGTEMIFYTFAPYLVAHYEFEGNLNDSSGNGYDGTASGSPDYLAGQVDQAINLDGINDYITLPSGVIDSCRDMTVAAWVYWDGGVDPWQRIFDFGNNTSQYLFLTPRSDTNTLKFAIKNGGSEQIVETSQLATGQWVHVAVTLNGDTAKLYVDGTLVDTNTSVTINPSDFKPVSNYIGASQWASDPLFSGSIDDFRIYNYALLDDEVARLSLSFTSDPINNLDGIELVSYNGQSLADYVDVPFGGLTYNKDSGPDWLAVASDGTLSGMPKALDTGENVFTVRVQENVLGQFDTATMTIQVVNIYNGTQGVEDLLGFADQWLMADCTDTPACGGANLDDYNDVTLTDFSIFAHNWLISEDLQLHLKFDEMSGAIANDSSIYWRSGSLVNNPVWSTGHDGGALTFDGSNYVEIANDDGLNPNTDSWSVAFWMKSDTASQGALIVSKRQSTSPYPGYLIGLSNGTPTTFTPGSKLTYLLGADSGDRKGGYTTSDIVFNEWTHVCVVLDQDADMVYIYINGVSVPIIRTPDDTLPTINTATPVYIAKIPSVSSKPYYGLVDDVRIYNVALSEQEVLNLSQ